jgi:lipopolysaccharide/colanic/teichoic acid biosynthesis glycosyltransferase
MFNISLDKKEAQTNFADYETGVKQLDYILYKRIFDLGVSLVALSLIFPLFCIIAMAIKLESQGPVFFLQKRSGLSSRPFVIFKFRSMTHAPERQDQATKRDSRVTKVGRLLRRSSLDELPQLLNVIKGDMSIVGPRPHPIWLDEKFTDVIEDYPKRRSVKPGITGLAQVNYCRGETTTIDDMARRVSYDIIYARKWSLWLDLKIMLMTSYRLLSDKSVY